MTNLEHPSITRVNRRRKKTSSGQLEGMKQKLYVKYAPFSLETQQEVEK